MRDRFLYPLRPTRGEAHLATAICAIGLCGGLIAFMSVTRMGETKDILRQLTGADLWFIASGIYGALAGLYMGRRWLGQRGRLGYLRAVAGALVISFAGALIGGTLALPVFGTMFGPLMFALTLWGQPPLALIWGLVLIAAHGLIMTWRSERAWLAQQAMGVPSQAVSLARLHSKRGTNWLTPALDRAKR